MSVSHPFEPLRACHGTSQNSGKVVRGVEEMVEDEEPEPISRPWDIPPTEYYRNRVLSKDEFIHHLQMMGKFRMIAEKTDDWLAERRAHLDPGDEEEADNEDPAERFVRALRYAKTTN